MGVKQPWDGKGYQPEDKCDICEKNYAVFICYRTPQGNKDICGSCRRDVRVAAGQDPDGGGYPDLREHPPGRKR